MEFCAFGAFANGQTPGMGILPMRELRIMGKMPMPREKSQQLHKTEMRPRRPSREDGLGTLRVG